MIQVDLIIIYQYPPLMSQVVSQNFYQQMFFLIWDTYYAFKRKNLEIKIDIFQCKPNALQNFYVINNKYRQFRPLNGVQKTMQYQHEQLQKLFMKFQPKQDDDGNEMCWFRLEDEFNIMFYLDLDSSKLVHLKSIIQGKKLISQTTQKVKIQDAQKKQIQKPNVNEMKNELKKLVNNHICENGMKTQLQPIFINRSPLCRFSSVFPLDLDQKYSQFISSDKLIVRLLKIFNVFPNIKAAFNSLGGGASVNNLHFHLFFTSQMIGKGNILPIQSAERQLFKSIDAAHLSGLTYEGVYAKRTLYGKNNSSQNYSQNQSQFKIGVDIFYIDNHKNIGQAFVFSPICKDLSSANKFEISKSLSSVLIIFIDILTQMKIPFNILFTQSGNKIYLMIRDYSCNKARFGFMEASGVIFGTSQTKIQEIIQQKKLLMISESIVGSIKQKIWNVLESKHI